MSTAKTYFPVERTFPDPYLVGGSWIRLPLQPPLAFLSNLRGGKSQQGLGLQENRLGRLQPGKGVGGKVENSYTIVEVSLRTTDLKTQSY